MSSSPRYEPDWTSISSSEILPGFLSRCWVPRGDVRRLILGKDDFCIAVRHKPRALHDNPMFSTVMMHLQAQLCSRSDDDPLDLEAIADIYAFIGAPRPWDTTVRDGCEPSRTIQLFDNLLYVLLWKKVRDIASRVERRRIQARIVSGNGLNALCCGFRQLANGCFGSEISTCDVNFQ